MTLMYGGKSLSRDAKLHFDEMAECLRATVKLKAAVIAGNLGDMRSNDLQQQHLFVGT